MRITITIPAIVAGGAERVAVVMANDWAAKGWSVTILTMDNGQHPPFFALHPTIEHRALGVLNTSRTPIDALVANQRRIAVLRKAIRASTPDVVLSFMDRTSVVTLLATQGLGIPVIASEQNNPYATQIGQMWEALRWLTYHRAARVAVQSERLINYFPPGVRRRIRVMPNPVSLPPGRAQAEPGGQHGAAHTILALGRLVKQKGFDYLLTAFAQVAHRHPQWSLEIWGEGELRPQLEQLRDQLGLHDRAQLPGITPEPLAIMRRADLFVLSSRHEGFPTVLTEALATGLPVIAFDCLSGPREIIRDGVDGVLVPDGDVAALAATMDRLMTDKQARLALAARAPDVLERFSMERVMGMWETLINEVVC